MSTPNNYQRLALNGGISKRADMPIEQIAREYRMGATIDELAEKYGFSRQTVNNHLRDFGVTIRPSATGAHGTARRKPNL